METAMSEIRRLPLTLEQQQSFAGSIIRAIENGDVNALEVKVYFESLKKTIDMVDKNQSYKSAVIEEAAKYNQKSFSYKGAKITIAGRTTYDFSECGDPALDTLYGQIEEMKAIIKNREQLIKIGFDAATGEKFNKPKEIYTEYLTTKF